MYFTPRASHGTAAKPAIKRAALCFRCAEAMTQLQKREHRLYVRDRGQGGHGAVPATPEISGKTLFKTL